MQSFQKSVVSSFLCSKSARHSSSTAIPGVSFSFVIPPALRPRPALHCGHTPDRGTALPSQRHMVQGKVSAVLPVKQVNGGDSFCFSVYPSNCRFELLRRVPCAGSHAFRIWANRNITFRGSCIKQGSSSWKKSDSASVWNAVTLYYGAGVSGKAVRGTEENVTRSQKI